MYRFPPSVLLTACLMSVVVQAAGVTDPMQEILAAARRGDRAAVQTQRALWVNNPLAGYVRQARLLKHLKLARQEEVQAFLERYGNHPVATQVRGKWLKLSARRRDWSAFARAWAPGLGADIECLRMQSWLGIPALQRPPEYIGLVRRLWLSARSRPRACDLVFADFYAHGGPAAADLWLRMGMALSANRIKLARYLRRFATTRNRVWADRWLQMYARPADTLKRARHWPTQTPAERIIDYGIVHLAHRNLGLSIRRMDALKRAGYITAIRLQALQKRLFLVAATDYDPLAPILLARIGLPRRDQTTREWAVRTALHDEDWGRVVARIGELGTDLREADVWRFWTAYAHRMRGKRDLAGRLFRELAQQATYYGFLAADQLGYPYAICPQGVPSDPLVQARVGALPGLQRALALYRIGENTAARREWWAVSRQLSAEELAQAAILADAAGWHYSAVLAFANVGLWHDYARRFPVEYDALVSRYAKRNGLNPAFVYAVIRAESAFQPDARSSAGAVGLMQLSPGSARALARRFPSLIYRRRTDLLHPERNIALGTRYMADLLQRFGSDYWAAVAAYNAGPKTARRWRKNGRKQAPEIVVETLPYRETRDYVKRIFAFAVVYDWRLGRPLKTLSSRMFPGVGKSEVRARCPALDIAGGMQADSPVVVRAASDGN